MNPKAIITSALPYANGEIHLGHVASTYLPADITTRFLRQKNVEAYYICASDDFGTPILIQAEKEGKSQEILERIVTGRLNKRLSEITLLGQEYIKDSDLKVSQLLKKSNANVNLFVRYEVGDGIELEEKNFAEEVKAQVDASE